MVLHAQGLLDDFRAHQLDLRPNPAKRRIGHELRVGEREQRLPTCCSSGDLGLQVGAGKGGARVKKTAM